MSAQKIDTSCWSQYLAPQLTVNKRLWVMERKPKMCIQAGELVDKYEHARCEEEQRYYPVDGKGHPARRCPNNEVLFGTVVKGQREYERRDVLRQLVPQDKFLEGKWVSITCLQGGTVLYPLADVQLVVEAIPVKVEAAVAESLPVEVILGTAASSMTELLAYRYSRYS
eukprot:Em0006g728a